jgi:sterol desaturase/sphingolipid hydroxylase (fatty acid hydroxylase superfamily)
MPAHYHYQDLLHLIHRHPEHVWRDIIEVGLPTYFILLISWIVSCTLFELIGRIGKFQRIQQQQQQQTNNTTNSNTVTLPYRAAIVMNIINWSILAFLAPFSGPVLVILFGVHATHPIPTIPQMVGTWFIVTMIFDIWFYMYHRILHSRRALMKGIHSWHHRFHESFALVGYAMHPIEMALNGIGALLGALIARYVLFTRDNPMSIEFVWIMLCMSHLHTAGVHCGYDLNFIGFIPSGWLPYSATSRWHDDHHRLGNINFGGVTRIWDVLFKTDYISKSEKDA